MHKHMSKEMTSSCESTICRVLHGSEQNQQSHKQHYNDVIMGTIASQITSLTIVYSTVYSGADKKKHESSASLDFVRGIHRGPVNSPHKWPVTRKMFSFDDVIMASPGPLIPPQVRTKGQEESVIDKLFQQWWLTHHFDTILSMSE